MKQSIARALAGIGVLTFCGLWPAATHAEPVVPGSGQIVVGVGDDFEDPNWEYVPNFPKGSGDVNGRKRSPGGFSKNNRWYEGPDRGEPDVVKRVETPEGGLEGSTGALLMVSRFTGIPEKGTGERAQDDLFMHVGSPFGGAIPVSKSPSFVVRVFVPEFAEWEQRNGSSFGMRATVRGTKNGARETEPYWPGMFFNYHPQAGKGRTPEAYLAIRAGERGQDYRKVPVKQFGWWTLGMSFTPDGMIHYYGHPGIEDLTEDDHLASHNPYGFRCTQFKMAFFDVFNQNDGKNWSTGWVIDDPTIYTARGSAMIAQKKTTTKSKKK